MLLIPAIDLQGGKCVRLKRGDMEEPIIYHDDPVAVARKWQAAGAERLHLVDLDGAARGEPAHQDVIRRIVDACPELEVEVGGGIRDEETIDAYLDAGVRYVILGTKAVTAPHFVADVCLEFPGHIIVGLDARDGKVATEGWSKLSRHDVVDIAQRFATDGVSAIIFTDIARDGMLSGVNFASTVALSEAVPIPVIASGGVASMTDIEALCEPANATIAGVVIGRALYENSLDLAAAIRYVAEHGPRRGEI